MEYVSEEQSDLIESILSGRRNTPVDYVIHRLYRFLDEKGENETLDPRWIDVWARLKKPASRSMPPKIIDTIEKAISTISAIDEGVWDIRLAQDKYPTILLGAGASAPAPSSIPTVSALLPELWRRAKKIGREDLDRLATWCDSRGIRNIEDLLTAAYIANFSAKNNSITALLDYFLFSRASDDSTVDDEDTFPRRPIRRRSSPDVDASSIALFQDTLQTLFGLLTSTMILAKPNLAHTAISKFLRHRPETRIVTTNYDGCMDEALLAAGHNLEGTIGTTQPGSDVDNIQLIKMHGSINWSYCDSCQDVKAFDLSSLKGAFENDSLSYAVIGICRTCGGQRRPLLVPPLSFKFMTFPNLVSLWNSARRAIESSAVIIAVGYSFSEADTYITKMLSRSMALCPNQVLIVCDTDLSLVRTLRKRFSARIEAFDDRRILRVGGSCEHTLPKLLDSLVSESEAQPGHVPATPSATMRLD